MTEITPIVTPYFTIRSENNQRRFIIEVHGDIKDSEHNRQVTHYCERLVSAGYAFNADNVPFEVNRELKLTINRRRLDILYINDKNERVGVEVKVYGDVGVNHTAEQLKAYSYAVRDKKIDRMIFLVPVDEEKNARELLQLLHVEYAINIETY
jgi:hypothetical protein